MSNDLIFSILPREGKVPILHEQQKVEKVSKEAALRALNDEEKQLNSEEREAREKYLKKEAKQKRRKSDKQQAGEQGGSQQSPPQKRRKTDKKTNEVAPDENQKGPKHLDIYV
jgi:hypothetical protein